MTQKTFSRIALVVIGASLLMLAAPQHALADRGRGGGHKRRGRGYGHRSYRAPFPRIVFHWGFPRTIVVREPEYVVVQEKVQTVVRQPAVPQHAVEYTVYIPNKDGTLTEVTLAKTSRGFIGPQGELYPQFPSVAQLAAMYAYDYD